MLATMQTTKRNSFNYWVRRVPDQILFTKRGKTDYRSVLVNYLAHLYPSGMMPIMDFLTSPIPSPTTMQRVIAMEAKRRRG